MENPGVVVHPSNGFGIAGFVLGLIGVLMFGWGILLSILGLIFSIIQMRRRNNGLAIAGLVLSIIGIVFFILIFGVTILWAAVIPEIASDLDGSTSCFDAVASISIESACKSDQEINVVLRKTAGDFKADKMRFIVGENYVDKELNGLEYSISYNELGVDLAERLEMAPIVSGKVCGVSASMVLEDC